MTSKNIFEYSYEENQNFPFCVYRIKNNRTNSIYIGSSGQVRDRLDYHKQKIKSKNHHNDGILYDSIWCEDSDWDFKILSRYKSKEKMIAKEMLLIKVFVGRKNCYNNSISYNKNEINIDWVSFDLKTGFFKLYLNHKSVLKDINIIQADLKKYSNNLMQYRNQLIIKIGSGIPEFWDIEKVPKKFRLSVQDFLLKPCLSKYIYNQNPFNNVEMNPSQEIIDKLSIMKDKGIAIDKFIGSSNSKKEIINKLYLENLRGKNFLEENSIYINLTTKGVRLVDWLLLKNKQEINDKKKVLEPKLKLISKQEMRDVNIEKNFTNYVNTENKLEIIDHEKIMVAIDKEKSLDIFRFDANSFNKNDVKGKKYFIFEQIKDDLKNDIFITFVTRKGRMCCCVHPYDKEYALKRSPWKKSYKQKGDSIASIFRVLSGEYIAFVTTAGEILFNRCVRVFEFRSEFIELSIKNEIAAACSISLNSKLLIVTDLGFVIYLNFYENSSKNEFIRISSYDCKMGKIIKIIPLDRDLYGSSIFKFKTNLNREFLINFRDEFTMKNEEYKIDLNSEEKILSIKPEAS